MTMSIDLAQQPAAYSDPADRQRPAGGAPAHLDDPGVVLAKIGEHQWTRRHFLCSCRHSRDAHRHYRPGRDCALCECPRWSLWNPLGRVRLARGLRQLPAEDPPPRPPRPRRGSADQGPGSSHADSLGRSIRGRLVGAAKRPAPPAGLSAAWRGPRLPSGCATATNRPPRSAAPTPTITPVTISTRWSSAARRPVAGRCGTSRSRPARIRYPESGRQRQTRPQSPRPALRACLRTCRP
jgi:hypothetical protein